MCFAVLFTKYINTYDDVSIHVLENVTSILSAYSERWKKEGDN
jgi:hypothetical protein